MIGLVFRPSSDASAAESAGQTFTEVNMQAANEPRQTLSEKGSHRTRVESSLHSLHTSTVVFFTLLSQQ